MANHSMNKVSGQIEEYRRHAEKALAELPPAGEMQHEAGRKASRALEIAKRAPDTAYLAASAGAMAMSLMLLGRKNKALALFVGFWPVTLINLAMLLKHRRMSREIQDPTPVSAGADGSLLAE